MNQIWDPLWEYVLEDYDEDQETTRRRSRQGKSNSKKTSQEVVKKTTEEQSKSSGVLDISYLNFFDISNSNNINTDDREESNEESTGWFEGRDTDVEEDYSKKTKRGILRNSESTQSAGSQKSYPSNSILKPSQSGSSQQSKSNFQGNGSRTGEYAYDDYLQPSRSISSAGSKSKGRRLTQNRSNSESKRKLILKRSKSESSLREVKSIPEKEDDEDFSVDFGGFWDILTGAPPISTTIEKDTRKKLSCDPPKETTEMSNQILSKSRSRSMNGERADLEGPEISQTEIGTKVNTATKKSPFVRRKEKKVGLFRRRNKRDSSAPRRAVSFEDDERETRITVTKNVTREPVAVEEPTREFDPMALFLEVAGKLDPWGVDSVADTNSETTASETSGINEDVSDVSHSEFGGPSRDKMDHLKSLLDQPLPNPNNFDPRYAYHPRQSRTPDRIYSTEIRLQVNTVGDTVSEKVYQRSPRADDNEVSGGDAKCSLDWGQAPTKPAPHVAKKAGSGHGNDSTNSVVEKAGVRTSFEVSSKTSENTMDDTMPDTTDSNDDSDYHHSGTSHLDNDQMNKMGAEDGHLLSQPVAIPLDLHVSKDVDVEHYTNDGEDKDNSQRKIWRAACCLVGKKFGKNNDIVNHLRKEDAAEVFPTTRMIANGKSHSITGQKADLVNGVMGVPSDCFVQSEGPQSLYAYDYDTNEHMDVYYADMNKKASSSLSVRKLGPPPSLSVESGEKIVIQVEASTVSESDCLVRQGKWWGDYPAPLQNTPGVDVVGKVYHIKGTSESLYDLHPRQTVVSLVRWGGNSRYMTIHPNQVVKVPDGLDPAQVACLPETYLTAFQGLHMGQALNRRYRENSLKGKSVLIVGCMTNNMGKAIIELALNAGVANLYATAKRKHWNTLISFGVMPLGQDPMEWVKRLEGTIDIVLAPNGSQREDITPIHFRALVPKQGQLILCGHRTVGNDMPIKDWKRDQATLVCSKNKAMSKILMKSYAYDVYEEWQGNLELCKRDLLHLLELLERGVLKPEILDRLPLTKVGKAQELLESTRLPGFLVCEPWMRSKKRAVYL